MKLKFIVLFLLVLGVLAVYAGIRSYLLNQKIKKFKTTHGVVLEKSVQTKKISSSSGPKARYRVHVVYEYLIDNKLFKGSNYDSMELGGGETARSKEEVESILDFLPHSPMVYYNPENPEQSFLNCNSSVHWVFLISGVFLIVSGIFVFVSILVG